MIRLRCWALWLQEDNSRSAMGLDADGWCLGRNLMWRENVLTICFPLSPQPPGVWPAVWPVSTEAQLEVKGLACRVWVTCYVVKEKCRRVKRRPCVLPPSLWRDGCSRLIQPFTGEFREQWGELLHVVLVSSYQTVFQVLIVTATVSGTLLSK